MNRQIAFDLRDITAVIVAYNSGLVIEQCLRGLESVGKIIVVDNGSTDDTDALVRRCCPRAQIIAVGYNAGYGRGANYGLAEVQTLFGLLLNPDCLATSAALGELLSAAERYPDAALLGPQLLNVDGVPEIDLRTPLRDLLDSEPSAGEPTGDLCALFVTGAAYLLRMSQMRNVGFFDPAIFLYYEDDDLCLRVRRAGYSCIYVPAAQMVHGVGKSSRPSLQSRFRRAYHFKRSHLYVLGKYHDKEMRRRAAWRALAYAVPRLLFPSLLNINLFFRCAGCLAAAVTDLLRRDPAQAAEA